MCTNWIKSSQRAEIFVLKALEPPSCDYKCTPLNEKNISWFINYWWEWKKKRLWVLINLTEIMYHRCVGQNSNNLPVEPLHRWNQPTCLNRKFLCQRDGVGWTDGQTWAFHPSFCWAIKSFLLFFSPLPKVQIANMTKGQISAREKGVEQLFHRAALSSVGALADVYSPERGLVITPHQSE